MTSPRRPARGQKQGQPAPALAHPLAGLSPEQRTAASAPAGPLLVVAGAGSGKTLVLTRRIAHAIASGRVAPDAVLAIAFTNRAARELADRLVVLVGEPAARRMTVATFHAAAHRIVVRPHAARLGRTRDFSIYDGADARRLIADALALEGLGEPPAEAQRAISAAKARLLGPATVAADLARVWRRYQGLLREADALDLDDLIGGAVHLLSGEAEVRAGLRRRFRLVLVDEFQDTSPAQLRLLQLLGGPEPDLTAAGDEDQALYGFRQADVGNVLRFEADFPGARVVLLERNFRSSRRIVRAAGELIAHNRERRAKRVYSQEAEGRPVDLRAYPNEHAEAAGAARWCSGLLARGVAAEEVALLFRTRRQARPLERALLVARVPHRLLGGQGLFEHAEVRDALAHLILVANPRDRLAFRRALGSPPRGLGRASARRLEAFAGQTGLDLVSALIRAREARGLRAAQIEAARALGLALGSLVVERRTRPLGSLVAETVLASGLPVALRRGGDERAEQRLEHLRELVRAARAYDAAEDGTGGLVGFLAHAALASSEPEGEQGRVALATVHAAKGLEWCHVRVVGLEEGLLPHGRSLDRAGLEEERRLAYVAMTRARETLVLTWAATRGGRRRAPSRFLAECGEGETAERPA